LRREDFVDFDFFRVNLSDHFEVFVSEGLEGLRGSVTEDDIEESRE
jgi:hypothetical protein